MIKRFIRRVLGMSAPGPRRSTRREHGLRREAISHGSLKACEVLREAGFQAYVVGGAVRDLLLDMPPKDFDVATDARPEQVKPLFRRALIIGRRFRLVHVMIGGETVEVSTFRSADDRSAEKDEHGRVLRDNVFGTQEEDARRRDFTVNGLYLDPASGEVRDLVDGRADLGRRVLRAIGDPAARFLEDHLRLLRAVRLAAELDFAIEPATKAAVRELAPRAADVAAERTRDELLRLLTGPAAARGVSLLQETGLLGVLLPEVQAMDGVEQPPEWHPEGDVLTHTKLLFAHLPEPSPELALAALLHDVGKPPTLDRSSGVPRFPSHAKVGAEMAEGICRRLRLANESRERVVALVAGHMRFLDVRSMRTSTLKRFLRQENFDEHLALHRADCLASHGKLDNWGYARASRDELGADALAPPRLVTGHDLMRLGWSAGPELGAELARLEELQLEGRLATREEALAESRRRRRETGGDGAGGPDREA